MSLADSPMDQAWGLLREKILGLKRLVLISRSLLKSSLPRVTLGSLRLKASATRPAGSEPGQPRSGRPSSKGDGGGG